MHLRFHSGLVPALLLAGTMACPAQELSNIPRQDFWVTDGAVNAIAVTNDRVFIGGDFRYVGPYTGGGVPVDVNTMQPVAKYPKVNGSVHAVEPDGQGGWFIGGLFTTVGGRPRTNLAHITAEGEVNTNWVAHATGGIERGRVEELVLAADTLYVGGTFTNLGGLPRPYAGAVEPATGAVKPWAPQPDSEILAMAVSPTAVYLAGKFFALGGAERRYVGAVDKTTGETLPWNPWDPDIHPTMVHNFVHGSFPYAVAVLNGWVIFPGRFNGGFAWVNLAAFVESDSTGVWGSDGGEQIYDLKVHDGKLYVAGQFTTIGGSGIGGAVPRRNLAAFDPSTGMKVTPWDPQLTMVGDIRSLAFQGNSVYAVGTFKNPNPFPFDGPRTNADHVVQVNLTSGAVLGAARPFNNGPMWAAAAQAGQLFLGGAFTSMDGVQHDYLAELSLRDGSLKSWAPQPTGGVSALAIASGQLLVGGGFFSLNDLPRRRLAAYDLASMQLTDWDPKVEQDTFVSIGPAITMILPHEDHLFIAGGFYQIGDQLRSNLAKIDLASGQVLDWRADVNGRVEAVEIAGDYLYAGGAFSEIGGAQRTHLARIGIDSGVVDSWEPTPDRRVVDLSANSTAIYVSGTFDNIAGQVRRGSAAFSLLTGEILPWNIDSSVGSTGLPRGWPIHATDTAVYAMGGFFPGPGFRDLIELTPGTAELGAWDTRPYSFNGPKRVLKTGRHLFVIGEHGSWFGPTRHGVAVYEPKGFSVFQRIKREGDAINLRLAADQGQQVMVQRTSDFKTWTGISTNLAWEGVLGIEVPAPSSAGPVFYRAQTSAPQ